MDYDSFASSTKTDDRIKDFRILQQDKNMSVFGNLDEEHLSYRSKDDKVIGKSSHWNTRHVNNNQVCFIEGKGIFLYKWPIGKNTWRITNEKNLKGITTKTKNMSENWWIYIFFEMVPFQQRAWWKQRQVFDSEKNIKSHKKYLPKVRNMASNAFWW